MAIGAPLRIGVRFTAGMVSAACAFQAIVHAASAAPDQVSLSEQTVRWSTVKYATSAENGLVRGSVDKNTIVDRTFKARVLENRYLKVVLVPEFGGRILSIIYKPTGHEQLYRTEVGVPYGIGDGNFYYDWLMVYGGIFPTFPDAEHGKTWSKPWDFRVVKESADEVTVAMSLTDNFEYPAAPAKFRKGSSGIEATYHVTLKAGRAAVDARLVLKNPKRQDDRLRVLDLHDAGAGVGSEQSQDHRRRRNHRTDQGLQHARLVEEYIRRRHECRPGHQPFRKVALLQELADDGHRLCGAGYAGRQFLGRDQPRQ